LLIHFSTDSLLDGKSPPYSETDAPSPITPYGRAKADAEMLVAEYEDHITIRTSLIYSLEKMDHSTRWISEALSSSEPVTLFTNQIRNPVWTETLCRACLELAGGKFRGVINIAGRQSMSRAEFGLKLLDWWGIREHETLTIGPAGEQWPLDCRLDLSLATRLLSTPLLGVDEVLALHARPELKNT
jgi:dTDP-4-dehydrorhamnose reductase